MKNIAKNVTLSIVSLIFFILILEISTRIFWSPQKDTQVNRTGVILEGNNREFVYEGIEYKTNSLGIRYKELNTDSDTNKFKILALGDSYIWGDGLPSDELVTIKLENLLKQKTEKNFEVINAGIGGFNTEDEYNQLVHLYPYYKPNFIVQFFFTNDIIETNAENKIDDWKILAITWLRANSRFFAFLYYLIKSKISGEVTVPKFLLPQDYFNLNDSKPGWVSFKKHTTKIIEFAKKKGVSYCFVFIPTLTTLGENYPYYEMKNKVEVFVKSLNVPFLSYYDLFSKYEPIELWVSKKNTHWNGKATTIAADTLAKFLIQKKLLN